MKQWAILDGQNIMQIDGSDFAAVPASGRKNARNFIVFRIHSREEVTNLLSTEVRGWLISMARDEGVPGEEYDLA